MGLPGQGFGVGGVEPEDGVVELVASRGVI